MNPVEGCGRPMRDDGGLAKQVCEFPDSRLMGGGALVNHFDAVGSELPGDLF